MKLIVWNKSRGFSLVEILVAMVVLSLLGLIIVQMTGATSSTIHLSNRMIDEASQARLVFGCMGSDLSALIKRTDVPFEAQNMAIGASNLLRFVSRVTAADPSLTSTTNRCISIVSYQVAEHANNANRPCLVRAGKAVPWTTTKYFGLDATGLPISFSSTSFHSALLPQTADFDILAPGVIRLVVGFQLYPDNQSVTLQDGSLIANARGQVVYSPPVRTLTAYGSNTTTSIIDLTRISALVVGLVVIDRDSLRMLNAEKVKELAAAFVVPPTDTLPVSSWGATANSAASLPTSVPLPARQSLHVFQQFYPIRPFASRL